MAIAKELERIRMTDGKLPYYAWPGGYPLLYVCGDNEVVCPECANGENDAEEFNTSQPIGDDPQWDIWTYYIHYEGPPEFCAHCNKEIESAYGDPENLDNENVRAEIAHHGLTGE